MGEPKPKATTPPTGGGFNAPPPFIPSGAAINPSDGSGYPYQTTSGPKPTGAWFLRPQQVQPYWTSGTVGETVKYLNDPNSGYNSSYYAPSDLTGAYDSLDANTQLLFETVSRAKGGKSGSALFDKYVRESARITDGGGQKSPQDILYEKATKMGILKEDGTFTPMTGSSGGGSGSGYGPYQNTTTQMTNEFDAHALVNDALNQYLGRDADPQERAEFWKKLNKAQAANPQVEAGVTSKGGRSARTSGGVNAQQFAEDYAKSQSDYAETTANTTLMSWLNKSISSMDENRVVSD